MKKPLLIFTILVAMAFSVNTDWKIHNLITYNSNPAGVLLPGDISVAGGWSTRAINASLFLNRGFHTGTQLSTSISDFNAAVSTIVSPALAGKQNTLIAGTNITISGNTISAAGGGGSFNANDPQTRQAIAQISRDSAQNNIFPTSSKTFEVVDGKLYMRGERFAPTVQTGAAISAYASGGLDPGSTDRAGVAQLIVTSTISPADNTPLLLVSFGGTVYANPPSVVPAIAQTAPGIKVVSVTTTGFTLASTGSYTLPPGTYRFPYQTESL